MNDWVGKSGTHTKVRTNVPKTNLSFLSPRGIGKTSQLL